ncbi:MAG: hypothetical protein OZ948_15495 [Deltaproteobacteria bacterium]|nr:hypothetical protein [Deltaproteobacteria bacterium]
MTLQPCLSSAVAEKEEDRRVPLLGGRATDSADYLCFDYAARAEAHALVARAVQLAHQALFASSASLRADPFCGLLDLNPGTTPWPDLFNRLTELATLRVDWDPEGAAPPNAEALTSARSFLALLLDAEFAPSSISPSVEEGITFNFRSGPRYAAVEFLNSGEVGFVLSERGKGPVVASIAAEDAGLCDAIKQIHEFI